MVQFCFNWDHVSAIAGLHRTGFCFRLYDGSVNGERALEFLKALKRHLRRPLLILWDGAKPHPAARARLRRFDRRPDRDRTPASVRARAQSGRVPVGVARVMHWPTIAPTAWPNCIMALAQSSNPLNDALPIAACWTQAELF